jgi:hypothetical protein
VNTRFLASTLKFLQAEFVTLGNQQLSELPLSGFENLDEATLTILPKDDSALVFSEIKKGRDIDLGVACDDLFERVVLRNINEPDELELRNDKDVWNKVYKNYFEKYKVTQRLLPPLSKNENL